MNYQRLSIICINLILIVGCATLYANNTKHVNKDNTEKALEARVVIEPNSSATTTHIPASKAVNNTTGGSPFINTPDIILFGTDVYPVDEFKTTKIEKAEATGIYVSEQGGASVRIRISLVDDTLQLTRTFIEPGEEGFLKIYKEIKWHNSGLLIPSVLYGLFSKKGLLLWEVDSQVGGIPGSMWILYQKKEE